MSLELRDALVLDIETKTDSAYLEREDVMASLLEVTDEPPEHYVKEEAIQRWKEKKVAGKLAKAALSPLLGRIVAIGTGHLFDNWEPVVVASDDEFVLLREWADLLGPADPSIICGHNVRRFDIPMIGIRCAIHGIELPTWWPGQKSYQGIVDTMDLFEWTKLDAVLMRFGITPRDTNGKDVAGMTVEEVRTHCAGDVHRERLLIRRLAFLFPQLRALQEAAS